MKTQQKLNWTIYLLIGVFSIMGFSCKEEQGDSLQKATYVYKNRLESSVRLELYDTETEASSEYVIEPSDSILFVVTGTPGAFPFSDNESSGRTGDSVVFRFTDALCTSYARNRESGTFGGSGVFDLASYENYSEELVGKKSYTLRYEIGAKDVALGQSCN